MVIIRLGTQWRVPLVFGAGLLVLAACKQRQAHVSTAAYILGPVSNIISVNGDSEKQIDPHVVNGAVLVATHLGSSQVRFCSGSLIDGGNAGENLRVLANHHCFAVEDADGKATPSLLPEACTDTKVYFGFIDGQTEVSAVSSCQTGSLHTNFDGDLAVFTLAANPPDKFQPLKIWQGDDDVSGRAALIVHYPDVEAEMAEPPDGGAKLPMAQATLNNCKVIGAFPIGEWPLDRTLPYSLRHSCDLIHGSSGSGLIDVATNQILGVNWGGIKISYPDGVRTDNVATRASYVLAFLSGHVDEQIKAAQNQTTSEHSLAATKQNDASLQSKGANLVKDVKEKKCGVVAAASNDPERQPLMTLILLLCVMGVPLCEALAPRGAGGMRRRWPAAFLALVSASLVLAKRQLLVASRRR